MRRVILLFTISILYIVSMYSTACCRPPLLYSPELVQEDSLQKLQVLYNGVIWTNKYRRFTGDQFFLSPMFMPGTVSIKGHTYKNLRIKYDINSDEILTPLNMEEIIQLNKEMIDSFSLTNNKKIYRFINLQNDSASGLNGYCNLLYKGKSALYVKYIKEISMAVTAQSDGEFNQSFRIFVVSGDVIYQVKSSKDLFRIMSSHKAEVEDFISENKFKISKNNPESFIPVIKYYDTIKQKN